MDKVLDRSDSKRKKNKKKKKIIKFIWCTFLVIFLVFLGLAIGFVTSVLNGAGGLSKADFEINKLTTIIYDVNGNEYSRIYSDENRMYAPLSSMSLYLSKAFIAIEDERFETHCGIDVKRTLGATLKWMVGRSSYGGSTITQQLIKKVTQDDDRDWTRKVREIIRAIQLEQWLSKDQIIELYMNIIYLGEGSYGVETAAYTYFDKSTSDLSIAECALIAGLAQSPEGRNPYNYPDKAKSRQETVLWKMLEVGFISQEQYDEAKAEELVYQKGSIELASSNSYYIDAVIDDVILDLQGEKGITKAMAQKMVYNNGLKIYTCVEPKVQDALESVYTDESYFKNSSGVYDPELQSAMVVVDYKKGNVSGLVGGAGEKTTYRGLNRATQSPRQAGSNMKPIGVYAPGLEKGVLTAATTFDDVLTTFKFSTTTWTPVNYDAKYRGLTNIRKAIEVSINVVAAKAFEEVGVDYSINFLKKLGITTLVTDKGLKINDRGPGALALGGLTKGIIPVEMAGAYGTFANGGVYIEPKLYTKVIDKTGEVLLEKKSTVRDVMSKENAYILTKMMQDVVTGTEGTAKVTKIDGMDTAGKTGTTTSSNDRWYSGYTPYYAASVWVGYDIPKTISTGSNPSAKLWKAVMAKVHTGLTPKTFTRPNGVIEVEVCKDSGLLPTALCKNDRRGDRTYTEYFTASSAPTEYCTTHVSCAVCPDSYKLANPVCLEKAGSINIVCINRHYTETPKTIPLDYEYEVPTTYCGYSAHYCAQDEYGDWIYEEKPVVDFDDEDDERILNNTTNSSKKYWWY